MTIKDPKRQLEEISGIDISSHHKDLYWVHNDSRNPPAIFSLSADGNIKSRIGLDIPNEDWEDLTTGPCLDQDGFCIYLGEIGNNLLTKSIFHIHVIDEPKSLPPKDAPKVRSYAFNYPNMKRQNSEALALDPSHRQLFVIVKSNSVENSLYAFPQKLTDGMTLHKICDFRDIGKFRITGADISNDGRRILIRTYVDIREYEADRIDNPVICQQLIRRDTYLDQGFFEKQGEAIAYTNDRDFVTIGEDWEPQLNFFKCP